jgi:hypothetical protein
MKFSDAIPDVEAFISFEPEELGLRILPVLDAWERRFGRSSPLALVYILDAATDSKPHVQIGGYPRERAGEVKLAIREAWAWLGEPVFSSSLMGKRGRRYFGN